MIKLITGKKGTGKTKVLIDMINDAVKSTNGDLICIEKGAKLTYDISYKVRLVDAERFNVLKIGGTDFDEFGIMLDKLDKLTGDDTQVIFTVSADNEELPASVTKFAD